ncbi:IS91 family transposase [bacterium]|nr:IS91 family transposase [bacterium]
MRCDIEIADIIARFGKQYIEKHKPSAEKMKVLFKIMQCRTAALGGHEEHCDCCPEVRYSYNSCGNRHCPKCMASKQALWIEKLMEQTLPIQHYHLVFTVPHELNAICLFNRRMYYKSLFRAVWQTLQSFGYTHYGVETGAVCVLHSWGQNLTLHPHIHCLVPAAGYSLDGKWKQIGQQKKYLYPIHQLSDAFKGKLLDSLKRALKKLGIYPQFDTYIQAAYKKRWVVHCEPSMASADHVIKYLGQYTHRVAISNDRLLEMTDTHVTFIAKDYRDNAQKKPVRLTGVEFSHRFCQHILPKYFVKIRRYGIYNHTTKKNQELQFVPEISEVEKILTDKKLDETTIERIKRLTGFDIGKCPKCKTGRMHIVRELPRARSPSRPIKQLIVALLR